MFLSDEKKSSIKLSTFNLFYWCIDIIIIGASLT